MWSVSPTNGKVITDDEACWIATCCSEAAAARIVADYNKTQMQAVQDFEILNPITNPAFMSRVHESTNKVMDKWVGRR